MENREVLLERYEDALLALIVHDCVQWDGERLEAKNRQLMLNPDMRVPDEIDRRCFETIDRAFNQRTGTALARTVRHLLAKLLLVAAIYFLLYTLSNVFGILPSRVVISLQR